MKLRGISFIVLLSMALAGAPLMLGAAPLGEVVAPAPERTPLAGMQKAWQARYVGAGGDHNVVVGLGWARGISERYSKARGQARLDLIRGAATINLQGLNRAVDVWLLDNLPGENKSALAEAGDNLVRLGRIEASGKGELSVDLGEDFFKGFELDWIIVTEAGRNPVDGGLLFGTRPAFERQYTRVRLAAESEESGIEPPAVGVLKTHSSPAAVLVAAGLVAAETAQGGDLFFRGTFSGNGRTCATCHRADNNQGLDLDFIGTLPANDKLFIAELPVSSGGVPGLERPLLMRGHALILENVDGLENPTVKFTTRGVPHSLSMATSIAAPADGRAPQQRTGWSGDGAPSPGTLRMFPLGATIQHFPKRLNRVAGTDFVAPTDDELDAMEAFMMLSGRTNELTLASITLNNAGAQAGKLRFVDADARCNGCHGNAGSNTGTVNRNFNTGVERAPDPSQATEAHPRDGGFGGGLTANFDCNGDSINDCFGDGTFNSTPLIEAADTEPFFHNNSFAEIEDAITFYTTSAFANSPAGGGNAIPLSTTDIDNIGKFLRVINAAFNNDLTLQRNQAALTLLDNWMAACGPIPSLSCGNGHQVVSTVNSLLELANVESRDAIDVLHAKNLHLDAEIFLQVGVVTNQAAISTPVALLKKLFILSSNSSFQFARTRYGTGITYSLGEGNLLF
jgi:cytochrome c553